MRGRRYQVVAAVLSVGCLWFAGLHSFRAHRPLVIAWDLEGDGKVERVVLDSGRDPTLAVWRGEVCLSREVPKRWRPWKLAVADVECDGKKEIVVGVHKATRFFPSPHNCLFVYGWDGSRLFRKWLGSSLSKPFTDFAFADLDRDGAEELVSVEITGGHKRCIAVYRWSGFGFAFEWERGQWRDARLTRGQEGRPVLVADGKRIMLAR